MSSVPASFRNTTEPTDSSVTGLKRAGGNHSVRGNNSNWEQAVATGEIKPRRREMVTETPSTEVNSAPPLRVVNNCILQAKQLHKTYRKDNHVVPVLN